MKRIMLLFIILYLLIISKGQINKNELLVLEAPYFGQTPPGLSPKIFAPETISAEMDLHSCPSFSKDGEIVFWKTMNRKQLDGIYYSKFENNYWIKPQRASFIETDQNYTNDVPLLRNNDTLFFLSDRQYNGTHKKRIWFTIKNGDLWEQPKCFDSFEPTDVNLHWQFTFSEKGNIYFTGIKNNGIGMYDLFVAYRVGNEYKIEILPEPINSKNSDICPYIAPDESYLIFASSERENGYGKTDLYICFKDSNNVWRNPINMGPEINSSGQEFCSLVSLDGKFLFYTSNRSGINSAYWISTKIIENLRLKDL